MGTLSRTNIVLAVLVVITALLTLGSGVDYSRPNIEILPHMKYSPAYGAFEANPNFPNGRTLQSPVPGTIARGQLLLHYETTPEDALRAGEELDNPTLVLDESAQRASALRGGEVYQILCVACHGSSGKGDGPVPQHGFPPPPSLQTGKSVQMKDGQLFHVLTYGQGSMPKFAAQLSPERRWEVINFIRTLQPKVDAVEEAVVDEGVGEIETEETPQPEQAATEEPTPEESTTVEPTSESSASPANE